MGERDWRAWHEPYDQQGSSLARRLEIVQRRLVDALDSSPDGPVTVISMCAGQGRDLLGVLDDHRRRADVHARLVELDERNVGYAIDTVAARGLHHIEVVLGDASTTSAYEGMAPADVVLVCGVFGNVSDEDIHATILELRHLCRRGSTVIWTRHRRPPDRTPRIRAWFSEAGFEEVAFDCEDGFLFGIGTHRFVGEPRPFRSGIRLFDFVGDGQAADL